MEMKNIEDFPEVSFIEDMSIEDIEAYYLDAMQEKYRSEEHTSEPSHIH